MVLFSCVCCNEKLSNINCNNNKDDDDNNNNNINK